MSLHPDIMDAMIAAGASAGMDPGAVLVMVQAACRAAWNIVQRNAETVSCNAETVAATSPQTSTPRVRAYRERQRAKREAVSTGVSSTPLSLSKDLSKSEEREREVKRGNVSSVSLSPMSPDWQPNDNALQLAKETLGDIGAANCLAKFRDHYESTGAQLTPVGWQAKFRKWVRSERGFAGSDQRALPLVRKLDATGPPRGWQPGMPTDEELRRQWSVADG